MIDLRSDTVTKPSEAMRATIAAAQVGDDVLGDDPTVIALERRTADLLGKEAALYMPSGTMTNQVAIRTHTQPGDEMFCEATSHVYLYEGGGPAANSGVTVNLLPGCRGIFTADELAAAILPPDVHHPSPRLVSLENTHNRGGGSVWPIDQMAAVSATAREAGLNRRQQSVLAWLSRPGRSLAFAEYARFHDGRAGPSLRSLQRDWRGLREAGWIVRGGDRRWQLSTSPLEWGGSVALDVSPGTALGSGASRRNDA